MLSCRPLENRLKNKENPPRARIGLHPPVFISVCEHSCGNRVLAGKCIRFGVFWIETVQQLIPIEKRVTSG
jgi:hypothetical protein